MQKNAKKLIKFLVLRENPGQKEELTWSKNFSSKNPKIARKKTKKTAHFCQNRKTQKKAKNAKKNKKMHFCFPPSPGQAAPSHFQNPGVHSPIQPSKNFGGASRQTPMGGNARATTENRFFENLKNVNS